jgi:hypothetical protein
MGPMKPFLTPFRVLSFLLGHLVSTLETLFSSSLTKLPNKLECLSLANLFSQVYYLRVKPEPSEDQYLTVFRSSIGTTTFSITTLSITTFSIMTFGIIVN